MGHSLGSPGEFDPAYKPPVEAQPENPDGPIRRIEDEIEDQDSETPTTEELEKWNVSEDPDLSESPDVEALQELILGAALQGREPEYVLFPEHIAMFVHHDIMDKDEARDYLRSRGINLR